jgi:predicted RNA-binding Zn-ribbon protein involved in translation (DUF1610 family)
MLERPSPGVAVFLERATQAHDRALCATDATGRDFHERMETSWLRVAASAAFGERLDRLLHTRADTVPATDRCPHCARLMMLRTIEPREREHVYSFRCTSCGASEERIAQA